jgi:hypothetical protein
MTPSQLSAALRRIASGVDASRSPDRGRVAADLRALLSRVAARTDVLNSIDAAFSAAGVYPPVMRETAKDVYEGEIDTGWVLEVTDAAAGPSFLLNGKKVKDPDDAARAYKSKNPRYSGKPGASGRPSGPPDFEEGGLYCLYPRADDEEGGTVERTYDVKVWDLPDGSHYVTADQTSGPPSGPGFENEILFDAEWKADSDNKHFFYYLLNKTKHPLEDKFYSLM